MAPFEPVQVRLIPVEEAALANRLVGAAGATVIPDWVAVMREVVSVTVTDCVPGVSNVSEKVCTPSFKVEFAGSLALVSLLVNWRVPA